MSNNPSYDPLLNPVADLYTRSLAEHGLAPMGVGWKSEEQQRLRFDKLVEVIDRTSAEPVTVSDYGCGYAAMFGYLDGLLGERLAGYYGYDISPEMLEAARAVVSDPRAVFIQSAKLTQPTDYAFVSGTFNVKIDADDAAWTAYVQSVLLDLAANTRRGLAFNACTTYVDWKADNLYYADPFQYFDFCKRHLSKYVSLLHDYPLYEWTMLVKMDGQPR
jgi:SAM-dependent methyltransferase